MIFVKITYPRDLCHCEVGCRVRLRSVAGLVDRA